MTDGVLHHPHMHPHKKKKKIKNSEDNISTYLRTDIRVPQQ